jgi:hypothetical protein
MSVSRQSGRDEERIKMRFVVNVTDTVEYVVHAADMAEVLAIHNSVHIVRPRSIHLLNPDGTITGSNHNHNYNSADPYPTRYLMVLNDRDTFSTLDGCRIVSVPDGWTAEQIEDVLDHCPDNETVNPEDLLVVKSFGATPEEDV